MDLERLSARIARTWDESILDRLTAYVRIPNKSPMFDPLWERNGYMEAAVQLMAEWCRAQKVPGARVDVRRLPGRTPLLLVDVPGELPGCTLLYGHLDKHRSSAAGYRASVPGSPSYATAGSMVAVRPMMGTRCSAPSPLSQHSRSSRCTCRAACC